MTTKTGLPTTEDLPAMLDLVQSMDPAARIRPGTDTAGRYTDTSLVGLCLGDGRELCIYWDRNDPRNQGWAWSIPQDAESDSLDSLDELRSLVCGG